MVRELAKELLEEKCQSCQQIRPFPKVLVVLRKLGRHVGAEVYAERGVLVRCLELPVVRDDSEIEPLVEQLIQAKLPKTWRHMTGLPSRQIQTEVFRGLTPEKALHHAEMLGLIRRLNRRAESGH
jgi:hypothetical protein